MKKIMTITHGYLVEVYDEMKKVSFPTRSQVIRDSFIVIVFTILAALAFGLIDVGLVQAVKLFIIDKAN